MFTIFRSAIPEVTVDEVKQSMDAKQQMQLLDVRTPQEFVDGHIAGSLNLPVEVVKEYIESIMPNKEKKLYVYCRSGSRSAHAVKGLMQLGYKHVYNVKHGLLAWHAKGYQLVQ